jgi:hypothetical protein
LPAESKRKYYPKTLLQSFHIAEIVFGWRVPLAMALDLRIDREARDFAIGDSPPPREGCRREWPYSTVGAPERPIAAGIEVN